MNRRSIKKIALVGILSAMSVILVMLIHFPIFPAVAFLEYDPADIPVFIVTLMFGPTTGLGMTAVVSIVQGLTVSSASGVVGIIMHFLATGSYVAAMSAVLYIHKKNTISAPKILPNSKRIVVSMLAGIIAMTVVMALWNLIFTPYFMHVTFDDLLPLYPFIIAFNLLKATINSVVTFILYLSLKKVMAGFLSVK